MDLIILAVWLYIGFRSTVFAVRKLGFSGGAYYELVICVAAGPLTALVCLGNFWLGRTLEKRIPQLFN